MEGSSSHSLFQPETSREGSSFPNSLHIPKETTILIIGGSRTNSREHFPNIRPEPLPYTKCQYLGLVCFPGDSLLLEPIFRTRRCLDRYSSSHSTSNPQGIRLRILVLRSKWDFPSQYHYRTPHDVQLRDHIHHDPHELLESKEQPKKPKPGWQSIYRLLIFSSFIPPFG